MSEPTYLVEVWRGDILESRHRGHAAVCDASGAVLAAWGDPDRVILPRSSCKMLQALPLIESGAGRDLDPERLALACASHEGARIHVARVARWLEEMGMGEGDLRCGPQVPEDRDERRRLIKSDAMPGQLHNNCSGKHAGFLMLGRFLAAEPDYVEPGHPVQVAVRDAFEEMTGAESPGYGIDGCSAPNFATTLAGLAGAMARLADPAQLGVARGGAARRLVDAMMAHPLLVAGEGRACSELMTAMAGKAAIKTGAEGVYTAILPERGLGAAVKIEDGATRAAECAITAILVRLGAIEAGHPAAARRLAPPITSRSGLPAGRIGPDAAFFAGGAAL